MTWSTGKNIALVHLLGDSEDPVLRWDLEQEKVWQQVQAARYAALLLGSYDLEYPMVLEISVGGKMPWSILGKNPIKNTIQRSY